MLLSGIQKFTLLDYPDHTSCIVFTPGCNFRCGYCHNKEFVLPELIQELKEDFIPEEVFFHFLDKRKNLLDAVVISGGEPTMMGDLLLFMRKIKEKGFLVKLDTNGNRPEILEKALAENLVDYIAMDVKTSLLGYKELVGNLANETNLKRSIEMIKNSGKDYEFRCTLIKDIHTPEILYGMKEILRGAKKFFLQSFRNHDTLHPLFSTFEAFSASEMEEIAEFFRDGVEEVVVRS